MHEVRAVVPAAYEEIRTDLRCTVRESLVVLSELDEAPQEGIWHDNQSSVRNLMRMRPTKVKAPYVGETLPTVTSPDNDHDVPDQVGGMIASR